MKNQFEKSPEHIPVIEEVMNIITRHLESSGEFVTLRKLDDEKGLRLLDVRTEGEKSGETIEYLYTRKGLLSNEVMTAETSIEVSYYENGEIVFGERVAIYNHQRNEWDEIK